MKRLLNMHDVCGCYVSHQKDYQHLKYGYSQEENRLFQCRDRLFPVFKHGFLRSEENVYLVVKIDKINIFFRPEEAMFEKLAKSLSLH